MTLVASLGMYDSPALHEANDRLWFGIAERLRDAGIRGVPSRLDRDRPLEEIWHDPSLLLAQVCGYPLVTAYRDRLTYLATPLYLAPGCLGPSHRSRIVVGRAANIATLRDCEGLRVAVNDATSNSGMNLLRALVAPLATGGRFFSEIVFTGSHAASAAAVATGHADVAAIDTVTFAHLERERPEVTRALHTVAWSARAPSLPFVTSSNTPPATLRALRQALRHVLAADETVRGQLLLDGVACIGVKRYAALLALEGKAARAGYPRLG